MEKFDSEKQPIVNDEFGQSGKLRFTPAPKFKENPEVLKSIEFQRYKQDCRKRALEIGMDEAKSGTGPVDSGYIITLADKYYNWLISIPNEK